MMIGLFTIALMMLWKRSIKAMITSMWSPPFLGVQCVGLDAKGRNLSVFTFRFPPFWVLAFILFFWNFCFYCPFVNFGGLHEKGASASLHWHFLLRHFLRRSAAGVLSAPSADSDGFPAPPAPGGGAAPVSFPGLCRRCAAAGDLPSKKEEAVISHGSRLSLSAFHFSNSACVRW